jgi:phage terminase large subunit-like protein
MKFLEQIVLDGRLHHDGCPALTWMISNTMAKRDEGDNIKPIKERNENKIDAVVALIMAIGRSMTTPATQQSIYNEAVYL